MAYLGCIADDFTGATDLANNLTRAGMRTIQLIGPDAAAADDGSARDHDAVVVALKSRSIDPGEAVQLSLDALAYLQNIGCKQFYFKYCSTFDSTDDGNIGPVAEALLAALETNSTIYCPAFPETGRSVYMGHLFVGERLLNESGMQNHPLTPMTDADLVRVLQRQCTRAVGKITAAQMRPGASAVREQLQQLAAENVPHVVVDTLSDDDLFVLGEACLDLPLVTGGSGLAIGMARALNDAGRVVASGSAGVLDASEGPSALLAGSSSVATRAQVAWAAQRMPAMKLEPVQLHADEGAAQRALDWAIEQLDSSSASGPLLIYATDTPEKVAEVQRQLGREIAGQVVEQAMAHIARGLVAAGVQRLVVAGGETSGALERWLKDSVSRRCASVRRLTPVFRPFRHCPTVCCWRSNLATSVPRISLTRPSRSWLTAKPDAVSFWSRKPCPVLQPTSA
jgi:uncharacterized protein YgbK (DUF1537 family)